MEELATGKLFYTANIIQVEDMPEGVELPDREAGVIHEVDDREETQQPRKRPGRTRGKVKLLQLETEMETVDWGELQNRGAQMLSRELQLLEEDSGEVRNERFLKALTMEVEEISQEAVRANQQEERNMIAEIEKKSEEAPEFLQTRMVGLSEVRRNLEEWKPSMVEEYGALVVEPEAVEPISRERMKEMKEEAASSGKTFDLLPAKAIFSRKAGSGRHKCRGVACGNYMKLRSDESTFASGAGGPEVRFILKVAAIRGWSASTVDVKTAFLNAPGDNSADRGVVIVEPPRLFRDAQVLRHPEELWLVRKALYGLTTSPKDWCIHRDKCIQEFNWRGENVNYKVERTAQDDVWGVYGCREGESADWKLAGLCDIIITGVREVIDGMHQKIRESWKIGEPSWIEDGGDPLRFLGMEIEKKGQDLAIHQRAYLESLFLEYDEQGKGSLGQVKTLPKGTGELLWVAGRTRPDVCLAVSIMCQWATKRPRAVMAIGRQVRAYLRQTREEALYISGTVEVEGEKEKENGLSRVEVYSDASYASSDMKSLRLALWCALEARRLLGILHAKHSSLCQLRRPS